MNSQTLRPRLGVYRYGHPEPPDGLLIGVARYLPRGVRRQDYANRGYFDLWLPLLSPSASLVAAYRKNQITFRRFAANYRGEMRQPAPRQVIRLIAAISRCQPVRLGCFCEDANRCHRSVLRKLIETSAAQLPRSFPQRPEFFSPACSMPEIED